MGLLDFLFGKKEPYSPEVRDLEPDQLKFVRDQTQLAKAFIAKYTEHELKDVLDLENMDDVIESWKNADINSRESTESVIDMLGAAFGQSLVEKLNLEWQLFADKQGTDIAVIHKQYFIYGFPFSSVEKAVLEIRPGALNKIYEIMAEQLETAKQEEVKERS